MYQELIERLNQSLYQNKYCYLLIDMLGYVSEVNPLHLDSLKGNVKLDHISIIARPELAYDLNSCPHLICIKQPNGNLDDELLRASVGIVKREHLFTKNYVCGWVVSEFSPDVLASKCLDFATQYGQLFNIPFLPFYEPFRMQLLQDCNGLFSRWLPSIIDWCDVYLYVDVSLSIRTVNRIQNCDPIHRVLTEDEKYYQRQAKNLLALYKAWNNIHMKINQTEVPVSKEQLIQLCEYSYQARTLGIINTQDNDIFVLFSMHYGSLLDSVIIKNQILASKDEPGTLSERLKQIDIEEFAKLSYGMGK